MKTLEASAIEYDKKVNKILNKLKSNKFDINKFTLKNMCDMAEGLGHIKIRDGFFWKTNQLSEENLVIVTNNLIDVADTFEKQTEKENPGIEVTKLLISDLYLVITALQILIAARDDSESNIKAIEKAYEKTNELGGEQSLLGLFQQLIVHNIPPRIFKESIDALTYETVLGD